MSLIVVYKQQSDHGGIVRDYMYDFEKKNAQRLNEVDPDTIQGSHICKLQDIVEYPTIIATTNDGQLRASWKGIPLPTLDEVSSYVQ